MADEIANAAVRFVADDLKQKLIGDAEVLMQSALNFIKKLEQIVKQYEHTQNLIRAEGGGESLSRLKLTMQKSKDSLTKIIDAQYTFQESVNTFLGRQIHFAWVDIDTGQAYLIKETSAKEIYKLAKSSSGTSGRISLKNQNTFNEFQTKIKTLPSFVQDEYKELLQERIDGHTNLIKTVFERVNQNSDPKNPWYEEHAKTVYWRHPPFGVTNNNKYSWSAVTRPGFIAQGYIRFIFNSIEKLSGEKEEIEYSIGHFMMTFVESADQIPGIVKGDIIVENTEGKVQIAVKSNSLMSTASIGPYISAAYQIISFHDKLNQLDTNMVLQLLKDMSVYTSNIYEASQAKAKKYLEKNFEESLPAKL